MILIQLLPDQLLAQSACAEVIHEYGLSFRDMLDFVAEPNNKETHNRFRKVITNVRTRHQVKV